MTNILLIILIGLNFALFIILSLIYNILKLEYSNKMEIQQDEFIEYIETLKRADKDE